VLRPERILLKSERRVCPAKLLTASLLPTAGINWAAYLNS
jgi:hypothetical protein